MFQRALDMNLNRFGPRRKLSGTWMMVASRERAVSVSPTATLSRHSTCVTLVIRESILHSGLPVCHTYYRPAVARQYASCWNQPLALLHEQLSKLWQSTWDLTPEGQCSDMKHRLCIAQ